MRPAIVVACTLAASLLLPISSGLAATPVPLTYSVQVVTGSGVLSSGDSFAVNGLSLVVDILNRHIVRQGANLVINGVPEECTLESVAADCSGATLLCEDELHDVVAGVPGASLGSLDGVEVESGLIRLVCKASPALAQ